MARIPKKPTVQDAVAVLERLDPVARWKALHEVYGLFILRPDHPHLVNSPRLHVQGRRKS